MALIHSAGKSKIKKFVIVDLAGTLVRTNHILAIEYICSALSYKKERKVKVINHFLTSFSRAKTTKYESITCLIRKAFRKVGEEVDVKRLYFEYINRKVKALPQGLKLLHYLKKKKVRIGILTNTDADFLLSILNKLDILKFFDILLPASLLQLYRPSENVFKTLPKLLRTPMHNILLISDSRKDIEIAKKVGLKAVLFEEKKPLRRMLQEINKFLTSL